MSEPFDYTLVIIWENIADMFEPWAGRLPNAITAGR
jgi:hypothetical protein